MILSRFTSRKVNFLHDSRLLFRFSYLIQINKIDKKETMAHFIYLEIAEVVHQLEFDISYVRAVLFGVAVLQIGRIQLEILSL